jgi:hypothetical protein
MSILLDLKPTAFQIGEILAGKRLFRNRYLSGPFHHDLAAGFALVVKGTLPVER